MKHIAQALVMSFLSIVSYSAIAETVDCNQITSFKDGTSFQGLLSFRKQTTILKKPEEGATFGLMPSGEELSKRVLTLIVRGERKFIKTRDDFNQEVYFELINNPKDNKPFVLAQECEPVPKVVPSSAVVPGASGDPAIH